MSRGSIEIYLRTVRIDNLFPFKAFFRAALHVNAACAVHNAAQSGHLACDRGWGAGKFLVAYPPNHYPVDVPSSVANLRLFHA